MSIKEYFGDWADIIDLKEADKIMRKLAVSKEHICPELNNVFKAFRLCSYANVRLILMGQDCYPDWRDGHPRATGLAFANASDTPEKNYSPSLSILRESVIDFTMPHSYVIFDPSLESWEKQGVLLLNAALSCAQGKPGSHMFIWRPFIAGLLTHISKYRPDLVYILMGNAAQSLDMYIRKGTVLRCRHPAYYARAHEAMPSDIWKKADNILTGLNGYGIEWYKEVKY